MRQVGALSSGLGVEGVPGLLEAYAFSIKWTIRRLAMSTTEREEEEEKINDPGNEDPGSLMDDAEVPLIDPEEESSKESN